MGITILGPRTAAAQAEEAPATEAAQEGSQEDQAKAESTTQEVAKTVKDSDEGDALGPACQTDRQCPAKNICVEGHCQTINRGVSAVFYYHKPGSRGHRMVLPFYYSFWRPSQKTQVVLPFFANQENTKQGRRDLVLIPFLYQYHREPGVKSHRIWPLLFVSDYGKDGAGVGLIPLFYGARRGPKSLAVLPPLLSFYRQNKETQFKEGLFAGLVYFRKSGPTHTLVIPPLLTVSHGSKESATGVVLGLGWYHRSKDRLYAGVFPLGWHLAGPNRYGTVGLPLFFAGGNRETGLRHVTLLPFFHYRSEDNGKRRLLVTPLGGGFRDSENKATVVATVVPPLVYRDEERRRITVVPPLAAVYQNKETGKSVGYVGPVFWSKDSSGSVGGLLPIYFRFHESRWNATTHLIVPVAAIHRGPKRDLGFVGPFYGYKNKLEGGGAGGGIFPLLMVGTGPRAHAMLFPLFAYFRNTKAGSLHVSVGPGFYRRRERGSEEGYDAGILPLLFVGRRGQTSYQTLLPIFYHRRNATAQHLVVGPLFFFRNFAPNGQTAGGGGGIFPLVWFKKTKDQSHAVVAPIFWYARSGQKSVGVMGPVFWQTDREQKMVSGGLFPLIYGKKSADGGLFLSPLVLYYRKQTPQGGQRLLAVGPYVQAQSWSQEGHTRTDALLPIAFFHKGPNRSAQVIFPLFVRAREGDTTVRSAAILYFGISKPNLEANLLLPIYARVRTQWAATTVFGPFFFHRRHDKSLTGVGLLPLFAYRGGQNGSFLATPLGFYFHNRKEEHTKTAFLLFYGDFRPSRSDWGLFPLLFGTRRGTARAVLGPLFYHSSDPAQERNLTVIGPLFFGRRGPATHGGLVPLIFGKNDGKGGYRATVVPLFHLDHDGAGDRTRLFTPLFGFVKYPTGFRAYLGTAYLRNDAEVKSAALLPLFYYGKDKIRDTSTTLILPLFFRSRGMDSTLTVVTPLLWQYSTLTQRTVFFFPFALDRHHLYEKRLTAVGVVVPLFIRNRHYGERTTTWIFPPLLTYAKSYPDGHHDFVFFPLFWHYGGKEKSTTAVFPLFYHLRRPNYTASVGLPIFYFYYRDENARTLVLPTFLTYDKKWRDGRRKTVVLPFYFYDKDGESQRHVFAPFGAYWKNERSGNLLILNSYTAWGIGGRRGAWEFHFWPLFSFGRPRPRDLEWRILGGFLGYSRLGIHRSFRLLWGINIPMEPVGATSAWYGATLRMNARSDWAP